MPPSSLSSGDVIADRRAAYAKMLAAEGEFGPATELMEQALERVPGWRAPGWRAGWFQLGEYREKAGDPAGAAAAYEKVLAAGGEDMFGARLKLALLGAAEVPATPPSRYAESLFDAYADRFEKALTARLDYGLPALMARRIAELGDGRPRFSLVVDLGCGTGLAGSEIRPFAARLEGFDISLNMLAKAREKGVYDLLARADLTLDAGECGLFGEDLPPGRADLALAADVMIYLGDLENVFSLAARLLAPGGLFAFSVEAAAEGFVLQLSLRYAHSQAHVEALFARHGFEGRFREDLTLRKDAGKPVPGLMFIAVKTA